nr:hypothetical protein [Tanacetum cinerariifolium]
ESEGIPEHVCDVTFHDNSPPLDVLKYQIEDFSESNKEFSSIDDNLFSIDDIDYVEASPPDRELVSSEVMEIVIPEVGGIDDDILLTINHDDLPFHDDHVKEISSGSPTTHSDSSLYASFMFDLSINPFPPANRSDSYEFTDDLIPFISPPEYDCFRFKVEPNSRDFTKDVESSNSLEDNMISELPLCVAVTPTEPVDSLNMGDEHLNTIPATESDEFIKSCVENLVPNPSESEGENGCDVPAGFTTFSNVLFDDDYDSDSSND